MESIIPTPDIFQAKKILCVQPHYDDNDIGAGGTLAKLHEAGAEIIYLTVTDDQMGVLDITLSRQAAALQLKYEQEQVGKIIGVNQQYWLDYPDAGQYDYYELRRNIIMYIRLLRPDLLFTPDPWLPYEVHRDHIQAGLATAEASILFGLPRISSDPQVDATYRPYELLGVALYFTQAPNTAVDISQTNEKKAQAVRSYQAQFTPEDMEMLLQILDAKERFVAEGSSYTHAEALKVMHPLQLLCGL